MTERVLILGGSGRFGRHASLAFQAKGWDVTHFDRKTDTLSQAAKGVDVIVNAWNPAYPDWAKQVPRLHREVQDAALRNDCTVIIPGNVYVFGADTPAPWGPNTPHRAKNPLGRIRQDMEASYRQRGVRTIILRAGDFIDTQASGNWFDEILTAKLKRGVFTYPGALDTPHAWAFLPDLAQAAVRLAEKRAGLDRFTDVSFPGYTLTGKELVRAIEAATGRTVKTKQMNWVPVLVLQPFWKMARHLVEMRYLWDTPHHLESEALTSIIGEMPQTPVAQAMETALADVKTTGSDRQSVGQRAVATSG